MEGKDDPQFEVAMRVGERMWCLESKFLFSSFLFSFFHFHMQKVIIRKTDISSSQKCDNEAENIHVFVVKSLEKLNDGVHLVLPALVANVTKPVTPIASG